MNEHELVVRNFDHTSTDEALAIHIESGHFTPFLGAGASSLRPTNLKLRETPWQEISSALTKIAESLDRDSSADEDAYEYLRQFSLQRLRPGEQGIDKFLPDWRSFTQKAHQCDQGRGWPHRELVNFQCALLRLSAVLSGLFADEFRRSCPAAASGSDCSVVLSKAPLEVAGYIDGVVALLTASYQLTEGTPPTIVTSVSSPPLNVSAIQRKTYFLALRLVSEPTWKASVEARLPRNSTPRVITDLAADEKELPKGPVLLRLSTLQWLADLLWYSLRYWAPIYPTTGELSFDLALAANSAPPRRAELAQAAEALALDGKKLTRWVQPIFKFGEESSKKRDEHPFYVALAVALCQMYHLYRERVEEAKGSAPADLRLTTWMPILFTTNFDRAMETLLFNQGISHHVVFPVRRAVSSGLPLPLGDVQRARRSDNIKWYLRTQRLGGSPEFKMADGVLAPGSDLGPEHFVHKSPLIGPVIVKLHGSPVEPLNLDPELEHWLALSESGYLEALDPSHRGLPSWLGSQLEGGVSKGRDSAGVNDEISDARMLWFLGYSLSDWNIRLRLYEYVQRRVRDRGSPSQARVVDRYHDRFRMAIFKSLKIGFVHVGDLNEFPKLVSRAMERISDRSADVQKLLTLLDLLRRSR